MHANYKAYDFQKSRDRIDEILDSSDTNYVDSKIIPNRDNLTFTNGYYICCSALFIDMRGSKEFSNKHKRPVTAKIYRSYISELVAVLNGNSNLREIYIEGDCVWGVFNTPNKADIDSVFDTSAQAASLIDTLNVKLRKKKYSEIKVGIAMHDEDVLMIKAGYKNSGINEVTWIGKLVGETADLCSKANKNGRKRLLVSNSFYNHLNTHNKSLLTKCTSVDCYQGRYINQTMNKWVQENG